VSRLVASDATRLNWQVGLDGILLALRAQLALADQRSPPDGEIEAYLSKVRGLETSGKELNRIHAEIVGGVELIAGDVLAGDGRYDAARDRWRAVAGRLQAQTAGDNYPVVTLVARAQLRLDDVAKARALAARVEASKYRHPAYAGLVNELAQAGGVGRTITRRN